MVNFCKTGTVKECRFTNCPVEHYRNLSGQIRSDKKQGTTRNTREHDPDVFPFNFLQISCYQISLYHEIFSGLESENSIIDERIIFVLFESLSKERQDIACISKFGIVLFDDIINILWFFFRVHPTTFL